jgi:RES domain-containing protein
MPKPMLYVEALLPPDASIEAVDRDAVPGWDAPDERASQAFGAAWLREQRSLVLLVPSVVTAGLDRNAVVNPAHPDAGRIAVGPERAAFWDPRLPGIR